jgi:DNA polymerase-3 subunit beta
MKFTLSTKELNYLTSKCFNLVSQKPSLPILGNILLQAANGVVRMTATDLMVGISCFIPAEVTEEGMTTLPAKKLSQLVKELTSETVEVTTSSSEITELVADSSRFRLKGMSGALFPALPDLNAAHCFSVPQKELKEVLINTAFSVSHEDTRYVLTGVFVEIAQGKATLFGTDGKRLSRTSMSVNIDPGFAGQYVIPIKAIEEMIKNLMEEGEAKLFLMADKVALQTEDALLVSKLLVGDYPDVQKVIPAQMDHNISLHREELMTLLRQVALFAEDYKTVRLTFDEGELRIAANDATVGDGKVSMPANYQKGRLEVAFNPHYFLDILRHTKGETVTLSLLDSFNPGVITSDQALKDLYSPQASPLYVLMPMRLEDT